MKYKAVIFDLDGTLLDTEKYQFLAWQQTIIDCGYIFTETDYIDFCGKMTVRNAEIVRERSGFKFEVEEIISLRTANLLTILKEKPIELMPGMREVLDYLKNQEIKLGVGSGSWKEELEIKFSKAGLDGDFDVVTYQTDGLRGKPAPDIYLKAVEKLGVPAHECLVLEDTEVGVLAARAAGADCVVVPHQFSKNQDFSQANGVFESWFDVLQSWKE
jgi:HAD superfamily hydrolase (TIGR01509 family)